MDMQPGQVIVPHDGGSQSNDVQPHVTAAPQPAPVTSVQPPERANPAASESAVSSDTSQDSQAGGWQYRQQGDEANQGEPLPEEVQWTAAEFIEHHKGVSWYGLLVLAAVVLAVADYFATKDIFSAVVIVVAAGMFGVYAARKPRTRDYHLSPGGLQIGEKTYGFQDFKNFSVAEEGAVSSIVFMPLKRFAPPLTIYVSPDIEESVLNYLSAFLPFEQHRADAVDGLLRRIHF